MANDENIVRKSVEILRLAKRVIQAYHKDREDVGFQEEPSLSDLLMVAQIMTQASAVDRLEGLGLRADVAPPAAASPPTGPGQGVFELGGPVPPTVLPVDLLVQWIPEEHRWLVCPHPEVGDPTYCATGYEFQQLLDTWQPMITKMRLTQDIP